MDGYFLLMVIVVLLLCAVIAMLLALYSQQQNTARRQRLRTGMLEKEVQQAQSQSQSSMESMDRKMMDLHARTAQNFVLMEDLSEQMASISAVMAHAKKRGAWGEYQMDSLIQTYLGENSRLYQRQYHLDNGRIADGVLFLPQTDRVLCIDSKFPMENFLLMNEDSPDAAFFEKEFIRNVRKHIKDVSEKYITSQTLDTALLFIPSESIYQYICSDAAALMEFAMSRHVMLVSPTTLCGVIFSFLGSSRDFFRSRNLDELLKHSQSMEDEIKDLQAGLEKASRQMQTVMSTLSGLDRKAQALSRRFSQFSSISQKNDWQQLPSGSVSCGESVPTNDAGDQASLYGFSTDEESDMAEETAFMLNEED